MLQAQTDLSFFSVLVWWQHGITVSYKQYEKNWMWKDPTKRCKNSHSCVLPFLLYLFDISFFTSNSNMNLITNPVLVWTVGDTIKIVQQNSRGKILVAFNVVQIIERWKCRVKFFYNSAATNFFASKVNVYTFLYLINLKKWSKFDLGSVWTQPALPTLPSGSVD